MPKKDTELFDRLRQVGLRKQAAKALSEVSQSADNKAQRAARAAANELRALADEIEQRLPLCRSSIRRKRCQKQRERPAPARPRPPPPHTSTAGKQKRRHHRQAHAPKCAAGAGALSRSQAPTEATQSAADSSAPDPGPNKIGTGGPMFNRTRRAPSRASETTVGRSGIAPDSSRSAACSLGLDPSITPPLMKGFFVMMARPPGRPSRSAIRP